VAKNLWGEDQAPPWMKKCELTRDMSTPESRAFWAVAERARERVSAWPEWKRNLKVLREQV